MLQTIRQSKILLPEGNGEISKWNGSFDNKVLSIRDFNESKKIELSETKYILQKLIIFLPIFLILL